MQCPSCGKTGFVIISNKRYCSACGAKLVDQATPRAISDLKPAGSQAAPVVQPSVAVAPIQTPTPAPAPAPKPAAQLHGRQVGSSAPAVLDLRQSQPVAAPVSTPAATPAPSPAPGQVINPVKPFSAPAATVAPQTQPQSSSQPSPTPKPAPAVSFDGFSGPKPQAPTPQPAQMAQPVAAPTPAPTTYPAAAPSAPAPAAVSTPIQPSAPATVSPATVLPPKPAASAPDTHPMVKRFPSHPAVNAPQPAATTTASPMPNQVATQVDAMRNLVQVPDATPKSPALQQVLANAKPSPGPKIAQVAAAIGAIAIMGGLVWMQNSPKMAFRAAANQAGIEASLPTYVPSSYRQAGPATVGPGQLTLAFNSPSSQNPLTITQRRTNWDSNSLRENFVSRQSDNMLAVQGQGLTIFLYNNEASWVNHGIWYTVKGTDNLSREQILRIAYGL